MRKLTVKHTLFAASMTYVVQSVVNCLPPLLFVTFQNQFGISLAKISLLISVNFAVQILTDLSSTLFVDRIGYRKSMLLALSLAILGFVGYSTLPFVLKNSFAALIIPTVMNAVGGGLLEVIASPIVEALPGDAKTSTMNFMHSFYCWGQASVALLSTLFFVLFDIRNWRWLPLLWTVLPVSMFVLFCFVPVYSLPSDKESSSYKGLFTNPSFLVLFAMMICAGATELAMSQWASVFAEKALHVSKSTGDLLGVCMFALCMGCGRLFFGFFGEKIQLKKWMLGSFCLGFFAYSLASLSPVPALSLIGCGLCGLSSALLWPGIYTLGAKEIPLGGTVMFALFAFAGDIGCTLGPDILGLISDATVGGAFRGISALFASDPTTAGLKTGMLFSSLVPLCGAVFTVIFIRMTSRKTSPVK